MSFESITEQLYDMGDFLMNGREPFLSLRQSWFQWSVVLVDAYEREHLHGPFWSKKRAKVLLAIEKSLRRLRSRDEISSYAERDR